MSARFSPAVLTPTLPLQVAERIGQSIIDEQFQPGERLKEVELALSFGVSRATIREALRILEKRGLVSILPQRGARVNDLSPKELEDLFEIRAALLGVASRRLAERGSDEDRRAMREGLKALEATMDDASGYARASASLVSLVTRLSGNDQIDGYIAELSQRFGRYARLGLSTRERREESIATWRKLVRAISAKDAETAEAIHRKLALRNLAAGLEEIERRKKP
jgi:DNA-binding GntR family transcriptional regulator